MSGLVIRSPVLADMAAVAVFQTACWQEAYRGIVPDAFLDGMDVQQRTVAWTRRLVEHERQIQVAWLEGTVVGVVSWTPGVVDELNTLYVAAGHRGTGLADRLIVTAIEERPAALWVFEANDRARRFYAKHRFITVSDHQLDTETGLVEQRLTRTGGAQR